MAKIEILNHFPGSALTLLKAGMTSFKKLKETLPDKGYRINATGIDPQQFDTYCKMFGFHTGFVPSTYWYVRLFKLQSLLMADKDAPFPMPGMVQLYLYIYQFETICPDDVLDAVVKFGRLIQHDKGTVIETIMTLEKEGRMVWEQKNYNLYIGKKRLGDTEDEKPEIDITEPDDKQIWSLSSKNATDFAKVSGDYNPIHLHPLFGKLFGFSGQIAHGWYSLSRSVAENQSLISENYEIYTSFKKPLVLPAKATYRSQRNQNQTIFEVINAKEGYPYLKGYLKKN